MKQNLRKWTLMFVSLFVCCLTWAARSEAVTEARSWDFTKGANHASQITDCDYWNPDYASAKGRTTLLKDLTDQELPSNQEGKALSGLEGIYFTVAKGAVYGISGNYCFQSGKMTVRIPDCAAGDSIKIGFCGAGSTATIASDNIKEGLSTDAKSNQTQTAIVDKDGDVSLVMSCSKGFRLYSITVVPEVKKEEIPSVIEVDIAPSLFTEAESVQWQVLPDFGLKMDADGNTVRVAADADDAQVVVTGAKFHGDHGIVPGTIKTKVAGNTKITIGGCNWGSDITVTDGEGGSFKIANSGKCWVKNDESTMTSGYYTGAATTLSLTGGSYVRYYKFEALEDVVQFNATFGKGEATGEAPAGMTVTAGESITLPANRTLYVEGKTLVGWNDGKKTYKPGETMAPQSNVEFTPVFDTNATGINSTRYAEIIATWDFQRKNGAPTLAWEDSNVHTYVAQGTCNDDVIDLKMDCAPGKINNASWSDWCQITSGTKLTIPALKGMKISMESYKATTTTTIAGSTDYTVNGTQLNYTYNGTDKTIDIVIGDGDYWRYVYVAYPIVIGEDDYQNVLGTITWAKGNETNATVASAIQDAVLETSFKVGTDLTVSGPTDYSSAIAAATQPLMTYQPTTSNPGCAAGDMIEYKVKLKKGLTLKVSSVEFDAVKAGTDNAYFSWSYAVDGTESAISAYSDPKTQVLRDNNANPSAPLTHKETISADAGREFVLRFYISNVANNKKMSIGNIKINGTVNGTEIVRTFKDIAIDFTSNPYTVKKPSTGVLPSDITLNGSFHDGTHGYSTTYLTVPVDGPVKIDFGTCVYGNPEATVKKGDELLATVNCGGSCSQPATWYYNSEEPAVLTIKTAEYVPFINITACDLLPMMTVSYYNTDGSLLGTEEVMGGSGIEFKYGVDDVTVPEGQKFRGWFTSQQQTALKIAEGYLIQDNLKLYARATEIENPTTTSRYIWNLTKPYFYVEDHEALSIEGSYYNEHGWLINQNGNIKVKVAGNCYLTVSNCVYSPESTATVTDADGNKVGEFQVKATGDGGSETVEYNGPATELSINFPKGAYCHGVQAWNFITAPQYDEATGYYIVAPNDVTSFMMALNAVSSKEGAKIFLPDGTYDLGQDVLTAVSGKKVSIVGQSREKTIIKNAPPKENEGIGTTATLKNSSTELYLQDLTLRNAMEFNGGTGRAVALQDCGTKTICKNVSLESYQDTYYSNNNSGDFYFEGGEIHGVVDYVCGGGDVFYNGVTFVNEAIKETTIAAPAAAKKFGYVMSNCTIETKCSKFNFGRSWQNPSRLAWINTTINQPSKLASSRFTINGMNVAADKFVEYNTKDAEGNVISPASNVIEFTHSTGNKKYETILTAEEAAGYSLANVFTSWTPDLVAKQVEMPEVALVGNVLSWTKADNATAYAIFKDGVFQAIVGEDATSYAADGEGEWSVRAANGRGGFGEAAVAASIDKIEITLSEIGFSTFCPVKANVTIPAGVEIYTLGKIEGDKVKAYPVAANAVIDLTEGVIVKGEANTLVSFPTTTDESTVLEGNQLIGAVEPVVSDGNLLAFYDVNGTPTMRVVGNEVVVPQGKAYTNKATSAPVVTIIFDDANAISSISADSAASPAYNLNGQKVGAQYKGIVVKKGSKAVRK